MIVARGTMDDGRQFPIVGGYRVRRLAGYSAFWSTMYGTRVDTEECWQIEIDCPFCGSVHRHGAGPTQASGDGGRVPHCSTVENDPRPRLARSNEPFYYEIREVGTLPDEQPEEPKRGKRGPSKKRDGISPVLRARILERDGFKCRRCGAGPKDSRLVIDHITPVAAGGTNADTNLQTLCEPCNQGKADRLPHPHDLCVPPA